MNQTNNLCENATSLSAIEYVMNFDTSLLEIHNLKTMDELLTSATDDFEKKSVDIIGEIDIINFRDNIKRYSENTFKTKKSNKYIKKIQRRMEYVVSDLDKIRIQFMKRVEKRNKIVRV